MTMFILYLPLAVFSFSVKSNSFTLVSQARISLHYSHLCTLFISRKHKRESYVTIYVFPPGSDEMIPQVLEFNYGPDCERACRYHPTFFNYIFSLLFLGDSNGWPVERLA